MTVPKPASRARMLPALEALTELNEELGEEYEQQHGRELVPLYAAGVRYQVEPPGEEEWDAFPLVYPRGWGDCEDLACIRAAELRRAGETSARADTYRSRVRPDGTAVWHAVVVRGDGTLEDPSALLGMPTHRGHHPTGVDWAEVMRGAMGQDAPSRTIFTVPELAAGFERLAPEAHHALGVLELLDFDQDWRAVLSCAARPEACSRTTRGRLSDRLAQWVLRVRGSSSMGLAPLTDCVERGEAFARAMGWRMGEGATARAMRLMREGRIARPTGRAALHAAHWGRYAPATPAWATPATAEDEEID